MKAKFTLLTHFSQRYAKVPLKYGEFSDKVGLAFDNMRVHRGNLHLLPHFIPALKATFSQADVEIHYMYKEYMYRNPLKPHTQRLAANNP